MKSLTRPGRARLVALALVVLTASSACATAQEDSDRTRQATEFVRLFFDEEYDALLPRMDATMQGAFGPAAAAPVRRGLVDSKGDVQQIGPAWREKVVQGYTRYRVPVEFETGMHDLLVVFDGSGKVAGFFHVPHVAPPATTAQEVQPDRPELAGPARPQHPAPPFPYVEEEVELRSGDVTIAGTLTLPRGKGPFPAAVLLTGSGAQDRDETILGHKPFLVLADHLTRAGIAVLRTDDRGIGGSGGNLSEATLGVLADDALARVRFLQQRKEIDGTKIGLIGHSEGGIVGPFAAARSKEVAFVVMLAGTGVPGVELMVRQMELVLRGAGIGDPILKNAVAEQERLHRRIAEGAEPREIRRLFARLVTAQGGGDPEQAKVDATTTSGVAAVLTPWYASFVRHDPRTALAKVRVPVLALNGSLDRQVDPGQNLPAIQAALEQAGNEDVTARELPGLNHLFQTAETGAFDEYGTIEETMAPLALDLVRDWIVARFVKGPK